MSTTDSIVTFENVAKEYQFGKVSVAALRGVTFSIGPGEFAAFVGPSGSGKTTLLNLVGCVDVPTHGQVVVAGHNTGAMKERHLTQLRLDVVGFVFQTFNLFAALTALQNVEFPLLLQRRLGRKERRSWATSMLEKVGLGKQLEHRPGELSGGQQQRVAVARALVTKPKLVLADEPTANLDSATGQEIIDLMKQMNKEGTTFVFSTHDGKVMHHASRIIELVDGRIVA